MQTDLTYRINRPRVLFENVDGELILVNMEQGCYFSTNDTGAAIWEMIEAGLSASEITAASLARFEGGRAAIESGVRGFLEQLLVEELLVAEPRASRNPAAHFAPPPARSAFSPPGLEKYTDMRDMLLLDPVHDVEAAGWPVPKVDDAWPAPDSESK